MCSWKIHQLFSLPSTAMLPRHIINSAPRLHPSQLNYQQSVMHGNHRALRLLPWYNLPQPSWTNNALIFPVVWNYLNLLQPQRPFTTPRFQLLNIPYNATYGNVRMSASLNMAHASERDPKRRRSSSGSHAYSRSKAQKRQEIDSSKQESGESKMYDMRTSNRGFTQSDWPKTSAECDWRRGPRTYEYNHQSQVGNVQIPKRPNQFGSLRVTANHDGSKSVSRTNSSLAEENTAPSYPCYTRSSTQSGLLSVPPQSLPLQPSRNLHSSEGSSQASQSDSKSTYRKRLWFNLPQHRGPQKKGSCVEFSIVSYNVLAQCLLDSNNHLYRHCDRDILLWDHRKQKLLDEIQEADADVICLQEVESRHFDNFFQPALQSKGYASMYKKRTGDKGDGCATFYKTSSFQEVSHTKLEYQRGIGLLDRDNVAIVVVLQPKGLSSSHQLCVANTHLLWNPRRGDIKLAQLGLLFAEIERLSNTKKSENTYHPVVLCGDFNSVPHCPLYKFVKKGQMRYEGMAGVDVSGQEPGRNRVFMSSPLWPKEIGVSSNCRYLDTDVRQQSSQNSVHTGGAPRRNRRKSRGSLEDNVVLPPPPPPDDIQGQLIHPFFFSSAYDHSYGNKEITTNHSRTNTTVDYIFYTKSVPSKTGSPDESQGRSNFTGQLSLVKRLTLFTDSEVRAMGGLPNAHWPSDHLSLQATLRLTPND